MTKNLVMTSDNGKIYEVSDLQQKNYKNYENLFSYRILFAKAICVMLLWPQMSNRSRSL